MVPDPTDVSGYRRERFQLGRKTALYKSEFVRDVSKEEAEELRAAGAWIVESLKPFTTA